MNIDHAYLTNGQVSEENLVFYTVYGFLIAPGVLSTSEIDALRKETLAIFKGQRGAIEGLLPINENASDKEVLNRYVAIHFPHKISALIYQLLFQPKVVDILTKIVGPNLKCMQSMLFVKGPGKAGQSWHQDEYYIPTRDKSLVGAWMAIDDATVENGCLWIRPGRPGSILARVPIKSEEYADVDSVDLTQVKSEAALPVEVKSGSVILFNGYTLHSSLKNKTLDRFRLTLVLHYMSADSMLPWDQDGKLPPTEDLRDIVHIAGLDAYAWKGTVDLNRPYLRPEILNIKKGGTDLE